MEIYHFPIIICPDPIQTPFEAWDHRSYIILGNINTLCGQAP